MVARVLDARIGAMLEKKSHDAQLPLHRGRMQCASGSVTSSRAGVNVDGTINKEADDVDPSAHAGEDEGLLRRGFAIRR